MNADDLDTLEALAKAVAPVDDVWTLDEIERLVKFQKVANPATVLALIRRLRTAENTVKDYDTNFPCDGGCNVNDGPEETCSRHGRAPSDLWNLLDEARKDLRGAQECIEKMREITETAWSRKLKLALIGTTLAAYDEGEPNMPTEGTDSMTEQKIDPLEVEVKAAAEKRWPLPYKPAKNANERRSNMVANALREGYVEGYKDGAQRPTGETFDEDTLTKVYEALYRAGLSGVEAADAVNQMQNTGILFRERVPEPAPADERDALDRNSQVIPLYAMLDVWMALYGTSHPEFDEFYAEHGYAETWARLMAAVRHPQPTDDREELIEQATWALIDYDTDVVDRGVRDEHYRERHADVERVFPILRRHPQPTEVEHARAIRALGLIGELAQAKTNAAENVRLLWQIADTVKRWRTSVSTQPSEGEPSFTGVLTDTPVPEGCPGIGLQSTEGEPSDMQCVRIANMAQEITGRSIWPSTVKAILRVVADQGGGGR